MAIGPESQRDGTEVASSEGGAAAVEEQVPAAEETRVDSSAQAGDWAADMEAGAARSFGWVVPVVAALAVIGWTGFFGWVHQAEMFRGATPLQWQGWIVDWAVPVLLVVALWLLAVRNSRQEARRFAATARSLSEESRQLETRLSTVNRELSLAREFIAAQSRDLESLGRVASDRLSEHADRLQGLIRDNGAQVEVIGKVSSTALENMDRLRGELPVIANSARDVSNQIGNAGHVAREQLGEMIAGMKRLNEFGEASGRQVDALHERVDEAVAAFAQQASHLGDIAERRFAALNERSAAFRAELDGREVDSFAALRRRAAALEEELENRRRDAESAEDAALEQLRDRADTLRAELAARRAELETTEQAALAAVRHRARALGAELDQQRHEVQAAEEAALEVLRARLAQLVEEGKRISDILREGETDAAEAWAAAVSALEERMFEAIRKVSDVDQQALANARKRLDALSQEAGRVDAMIVQRFEAFEAHLEQRNVQANEREAASLAELEHRLARFDRQIAERQEEQLAHVAGLAERGEAMAERLAELGAEMERLASQGRRTQDNLTHAAHGLAEKLAESRAILNENGDKVSELTNSSVRLLEIIRSGAQHSREDLPLAIGEAEERLLAFEAHASSLKDLIAEAGAKGAALASNVDQAQRSGTATAEQLTELEQRLAALAAQSEALSAQARGELQEAVATLQEAAGQALNGLSDEQAARIREMAERIGSESSEAIGQAVEQHVTQAIMDLQEAAVHAGDAGRETAIQLRDQLAMVNELAGNLERRVAHAREQAEETVDGDFTRRMTLITEGLNSAAIDIAKALDSEVTDTAWASYLRGDRGIFTRRAVRLLDNQNSKAVAELYGDDAELRETINRYIHDFEGMLRSVLSTREGNTLAVTLLSSDMGKLYVALAQSIDRLRS
ncbi:conserved hypothetical protein [Altererythrobacter sp. B11]|nr:conserved hypothetical protein [Altererythrobacter sp. B11]